MTAEDAPAFFQKPEIHGIVERMLEDLKRHPPKSDDVVGPNVAPTLTSILEMIFSEPSKFDNLAQANISWIGGQFVGRMRDYMDAPAEKRMELIRPIFTCAYRFFCEIDLNDPSEHRIEELGIMNFVHDSLNDFSGSERQQLVYAAYLMPAQILRKQLSNPAARSFQEFSASVQRAADLKTTWDKEIDERTTRLDALSDNVSKLSSEYNFVGLVHGFVELRKQKVTEQRVAFISLVAIGAAMIFLLIKQLGFIAENIELIDKLQKTLLYSLPALVAVELIGLYFFRVVLSQFRSVKAQMLQIDLRIALCQFVESYSEYAARLRETDKAALTKFEALIFSGLVAGDTSIPSTFDGAEQLAALVRSFRGAK
jgi:hypothetical protein